MDDLLYLIHSDGADGLRMEVGRPPIVIMDGEDQEIEGSAATAEDAERLLQSVTDTRQRRELREQGKVEFIFKFRHCASFVVHAEIRDENLFLEAH